MILAIADAVAAAITGAERVYEFSLDLESMSGRYVYVLPSGYSAPEALTRSQDVGEVILSVVVAERYPDAGPVPKAWLDERVEWVYDNVFSLDDARAAELAESFAWSSEVTVYDLDELRNRNLFLSVVNLTRRLIL